MFIFPNHLTELLLIKMGYVQVVKFMKKDKLDWRHRFNKLKKLTNNIEVNQEKIMTV